MTDIPELTEKQLARAIPARVRKRLVAGQIESGADVAALRRFVGLSQSQFAQAMGISVHTLRNWEQGRRKPEGPAIGLLRIAARHPRMIRENLKSAAGPVARRRTEARGIGTPKNGGGEGGRIKIERRFGPSRGVADQRCGTQPLF
jgi:putative transcriptional regulator